MHWRQITDKTQPPEILEEALLENEDDMKSSNIDLQHEMAKYRRGCHVEQVNQKNNKELTEIWGNLKSWLKILLERLKKN